MSNPKSPYVCSAEAGIKLAQMRSGKMQDPDWQNIVKRMSEISDAPLSRC